MLRLRTGIGIMALWLFVFFNLERLEQIGIAPFIYVLVPVAVGMLLLAPRSFARSGFWFILITVLAVFVALKIIWNYPLLGVGLPVTITEVASITLSLLLARHLGGIVLDFEDTIARLMMRQIGMPPRLLESVDAEDLYREVKRSRRFQHPVTMLVVRPQPEPGSVQLNRILQELQESMAGRYVQARVGRMLSEALRDCDLIAQHGEGFAVLLPEMTLDDASKSAASLRSEAMNTPRNAFGNRSRRGPLKRPLTLGGLIHSAHERIGNTNAGSAPGYCA